MSPFQSHFMVDLNECCRMVLKMVGVTNNYQYLFQKKMLKMLEPSWESKLWSMLTLADSDYVCWLSSSEVLWCQQAVYKWVSSPVAVISIVCVHIATQICR